MVNEYLREPILEKEGWIREGAMLSMLNIALAKREAPVELWYLIVLELWMRHERELAVLDPAMETPIFS